MTSFFLTHCEHCAFLYHFTNQNSSWQQAGLLETEMLCAPDRNSKCISAQRAALLCCCIIFPSAIFFIVVVSVLNCGKDFQNVIFKLVWVDVFFFVFFKSYFSSPALCSDYPCLGKRLVKKQQNSKNHHLWFNKKRWTPRKTGIICYSAQVAMKCK